MQCNNCLPQVTYQDMLLRLAARWNYADLYTVTAELKCILYVVCVLVYISSYIWGSQGCATGGSGVVLLRFDLWKYTLKT